MGFFDFLRRKPLAASTVVEARPAPALSAPTEAVGVSGTTNFGGRLQTEKNPLLRDQLAYGRAGTTEWGEWEDIRRTNPWVAAAVEFVTSPIEDATVDVAVAEKHPDAKLAEEQAAFVRWNLTEALEPEFHASRSAAADGMLTVLRRAVRRFGPDDRAGCLPGGRIAAARSTIGEPVSGESRRVNYAAT